MADWPHVNPFHQSIEKVSSDIAYDEQGQAHCGFDIPEDLQRLKWVKLLLETNTSNENLHKATEVHATAKALKRLGKTATEVVSDYLKWLWKNVEYRICERQAITSLSHVAAVTVVMTVPAMWSDKARDNTVRAAELAGIAEGKRQLRFLNEPEAAAISELRTRLTTGQIRAGDCVIICDAGGGTVDVVSYQVVQEEPLELSQRVVAQGELCGSIFIEQEFQKQIRGLLRHRWDQLTDAAKTEIMQRFAYVIKPNFDETKIGKKYYLPVQNLEDDEDMKIRNGSLEINSQASPVVWSSPSAD